MKAEIVIIYPVAPLPERASLVNLYAGITHLREESFSLCEWLKWGPSQIQKTIRLGLS